MNWREMANAGRGRSGELCRGFSHCSLCEARIRRPLTSSALVLLAALALIVGVAYLIAPTYVHAALHWWQPKWF